MSERPSLEVDARVEHPDGPRIEARFAVDPAETPVVVLLGPSGSGKTTILRAVAGLARPAAGRIALGGRVWFDSAAGVWLPPERRRVGYLFQDYALFPHLTVEENIAYGLRRLDRGERERRAGEALESFGLREMRRRRPSEISGGERQRTALARTLAPRPDLLLLDEPLSALDAPTRERLRDELRARLLAARVPSIVVTHDRSEAIALGDAVGVMGGGRLLQMGPVEDVFRRPADEEVARAVGVDAVIPARWTPAGDGLARYRVGEAELLGLAPAPGSSEEGFVCIRAEEVSLTLAPPERGSIRNFLRGTVTEVVAQGPLVRVRLDCSFPLTAWVTRPSLEELGLRPGLEVWAAVKAPAVHFLPHRAGPAR